MAMQSRWLTQNQHPFKALLGLEWGLLVFVMLSCITQLLPWRDLFPRVAPPPLVTGVNLGCLLLIGLLGLVLPFKQAGEEVQWPWLNTCRDWAGRRPSLQDPCLIYLIGLYALILIPSTWGRLPLFQLLYVIFIARSCLICSAQTRWGLTIVVITTVIVIQSDRAKSWLVPLDQTVLQQLITALQVGSVVLLGLTLLCLQFLISAIITARQSQAELAQANAKLRTYALQIEDIAILQERNRIAREIHDALGHSLTAFNLHLDAALRLLERDPPKAKTLLEEAQFVGKSTLRDVRRSVAVLRTDPLQGRSLHEAIQSLCQDHACTTTVLPQYQLQLTRSLSPAQTTVIYRVVQEALTNIAKHAQAQTVVIELTQQGNRIVLEIRDDGVGFSPGQTHLGFGLQGMRERMMNLNGTLEIQTIPQEGCRILAQFPISAVEA
jgi:signal transduction histidine kinase